jgi:hypothetical protein
MYPRFPTLYSFYKDYEMPLQRAFYEIEKRGILTDPLRLLLLHKHILKEKQVTLDEIKRLTSTTVISKNETKGKPDLSVINLSSPKQLILWLNSIGIKLPKNRDTGNETTNQEALEKVYAETGNPVLRHILRNRELNKIDGTYIRAWLNRDILYSSYFATGTVGGRRSSRKNFLGLGTNHQNLPKHSFLGRAFRSCLIARQGRIFVSADLKGAEDWIVHGIIADQGGSLQGINELKAGINRHKKTASLLFGLPIEQLSKDDIEYYLAKRSRHGFNYGMMGDKQSRILAAEGIGLEGLYLVLQDGRKMTLPKEYLLYAQMDFAQRSRAYRNNHTPIAFAGFCSYLNAKLDSLEPDIRRVYQKYIIGAMSNNGQLITPIGRIRDFMSLRPGDDNGSVFRDGFSYIPQSTVGDITGLAILYLETHYPGLVISDGHDAVVTESLDSFDSVRNCIHHISNAYKQIIEFPNGTKITIPIEFEIGYDLGGMLPWDESLGEAGLKNILSTLSQLQKRRVPTTGGQQPHLSEPVLSETFG